MNGLYVAKAVASCFSKSEKYPTKAIDFNERTNEDGEVLTDAEMFEMYAIRMNKEINSSE